MVHFVDDSRMVQPVYNEDNKSKRIMNTPSINPSYSSFLKRPIRIHKTEWTANSPRKLLTLHPLLAWANDPNISKILNNVGYIRPSFHLEFRTNATIAHYGLAIASYYPGTEGLDVQTYDNSYQSFCYPHVMISPTTEQVYRLDVPYTSNLECLPFIKKNLEEYIELNIHILAKLRIVSDATATPVELSIYMVMDDLDPMSFAGSVTLQAGKKEKVSRGSRPYKKEQKENATAEEPTLWNQIVDVAETVVSWLPGIGEAASFIGGLIGFDTPPVDAASAPMQLVTQRWGQIDGPQMNTVLGVSQNALLDVEEDCCNMDMSENLISQYISREGYLGTYEITSSSDKVLTRTITPSTLIHANSTAKTQLHSPVSYMTNFFRLWRGSLIFRYYIVSSSFHSARLRFSFTPGWAPTRTVTESEDELQYSTIVDINTSSFVDIVCPYIQQSPFLPVDELEAFLGTLKIEVINKLTASDAVVQPISLVETVRAGSDYQLCYPTLGNVIKPGFVWSLGSGLNNSVQLQGDDYIHSLGTQEGMILNNGVSTTSIITTFKQLLKLPGLLTSTVSTRNACTFNPYANILKNKPSNDLNVGFLYYVLPLFRFMRGSYRFTATAASDYNEDIDFFGYKVIDSQGLAIYEMGDQAHVGIKRSEDYYTELVPFFASFPSKRSNPADVVVPYDHTLRMRRVKTSEYSTHFNNHIYDGVNVKGVLRANATKSSSGSNEYRAFYFGCMGDDVCLSFMMAPPVVTVGV